MTTDAVSNNIDDQLIERQPINPDSHGQSVDSERAEPADESRDVNGQDVSSEKRHDAERIVTTAESAFSGQAKPLTEAEELDFDEDWLRMYEAENAKKRKDYTTFKVTQIRSHTKTAKRETTIDLPDGVTPDDINVDLYFEGDAGFENAGHEPCEIKTDWEILERSHTDCTLGVKLDIRKNVVADFSVTREELIVLGRDYLETAYDLGLPHGYPWSRRDTWDYVYSRERYEQIEEYIAKIDGNPCQEFEVDIYAYENLCEKANGMSKEEWDRWAKSELRNALSEYRLEAMCPPINAQLKCDAFARWEDRKKRANEIRNGALVKPSDAAQNEDEVKHDTAPNHSGDSIVSP